MAGEKEVPGGRTQTRAAPGGQGARRPTGTEPRIKTEPALWAVSSTGMLGRGWRALRPNGGQLAYELLHLWSPECPVVQALLLNAQHVAATDLCRDCLIIGEEVCTESFILATPTVVVIIDPS